MVTAVDSPKIAIVVDWLVRRAGAEKVLEYLLKLYPDADLFALIDFLSDSEDNAWLMNKKVSTSFLQKLPFIKRHYPKFFPLMPLAIESLDLRGYDIIISSSHCVAKGVITSPDQLHISYIHSPMRYVWDMQKEYLDNNAGKGLIGGLKSLFLHKMRIWDAISSMRPDHLIVNSNFIRRRVNKVYRREAKVIFPPVEKAIKKIADNKDQESFYFLVSRFTEYKNIDLIVRSFAKMPNKHLKIIGDGPLWEDVHKIATP